MRINLLKNNSGFLLIQLMSVMATVTFLTLAVNQTVMNMNKSINWVTTKEEMNEYINMLTGYINYSPAVCASLFRNCITVGALTSTTNSSSITLQEILIPVGVAPSSNRILFKAGVDVNQNQNSRWQTSDLHFIKRYQQVNYSDAGSNSTNITIGGDLRVVLRNKLGSKSYGSTLVSRVIPLAITIRKPLPTGSFRIVSCSGNFQSGNSNQGWGGSPSDTAVCTTTTNALCPAHHYYTGNSAGAKVCCRVRR